MLYFPPGWLFWKYSVYLGKEIYYLRLTKYLLQYLELSTCYCEVRLRYTYYKLQITKNSYTDKSVKTTFIT